MAPATLRGGWAGTACLHMYNPLISHISSNWLRGGGAWMLVNIEDDGAPHMFT